MPSAEAEWRRSVEDRFAALKMSGQINALGYLRKTANQNGLGAALTDITEPAGPGGLWAVTVVVGTRRLVRITAYAVFQKHTTEAAIQFMIREGGTTLSQATTSVDGVTDDYMTMLAQTIVEAPAAGTHTYKVSTFIGSGTADLVAGVADRAYLLVEDVGLAAA